MKATQFKFVTDVLIQSGEISRNECLRHCISRLGAIIHSLKKQGWQFATENRTTTKPDGSKGKDFVYILISQPQ